MVTKTVREIVHIDEQKCNGCGLCVPSCAEGALQIVNGKARLISEVYCDGLGACLGECPQGAITIEKREAAGFDEAAVEKRMQETAGETPGRACPSAAVREFTPTAPVTGAPRAKSRLTQWPVQLSLVPAGAPFLRGADILLVADCVPFAAANFHEDLVKGHALLVACPKLDDFPQHLAKLAEVLRQAQPRSLTVARMEVPCCSGLTYLARQAAAQSGLEIPVEEKIIRVMED